MIKGRYIVGILVFWGIALMGFITFKQCTLETGTEVTLRTVPVDPRDLFRGDYVILRYDISNVHLDSILTQDGPFKKNEKIYLKINSARKYADAIEISKSKYDSGLFISGTINNVHGDILNIKYGIESYFVQQGRGKEIEQKIGRIDVKVAVDKNGRALIKSLLYEED